MYINCGTFIMEGGSVSNNMVTGGGVSGSLTMYGGTISGNTVSASNSVNPDRVAPNGGGVYAPYSFTKTGGTIYGNDATVSISG